MTTRSLWRRRAAVAMLTLAALAHASAHALDLPGAAPQAPQPMPDYQPQRLERIFVTHKDRPMAQQFVRLDRLDEQLAALRVHAGNPSPRFNSDAQQAAARRDAIQLALVLVRVTASPEVGHALQLRTAIALSVAHNVGAPEASAMADARFERLLANTPSLPDGLLEYGIHLANTHRPELALVPLRRAVAQGNDNARWPLAISLASLGRRDEALSELDALKARQPDAAARYPLAATQAQLRAGG